MSGSEIYTFWQHTNGTIYITWSERVEIAPGEYNYKTKRISTGTKDRRAAEQYRAQFIAGLKNPAPVEEPTLGYILDRYRNEHGVNTRSISTMDQQLKPLKAYFGDLLPSNLSNSVLKDFAKQRNASAGTILRGLGILRAAIRFAEGERWIVKQPQFKMPVKLPRPREVWLTQEQVIKLIETAKSPHIRLFIKLAISTAARSGAILELKWSQIDFEHRLINYGQGHGNKRRTIAPMNDDVYEALLEAKEMALTESVIEYIGKQLKSIKKGFRVLCKDCDIKASPHVLRHTAATWMVMAGIPLAEVARLLGDSEKMVEKVYGHHAPDYLRRAVNSLNLIKRKDQVLQL